MTDSTPPSLQSEDDRSARPAAGPATVSGSPRVVRSDSLFAGATQVAIEHDHAIYFLRQTRSGKLILTK
jgi:hemin uptake protein HemP